MNTGQARSLWAAAKKSKQSHCGVFPLWNIEGKVHGAASAGCSCKVWTQLGMHDVLTRKIEILLLRKLLRDVNIFHVVSHRRLCSAAGWLVGAQLIELPIVALYADPLVVGQLDAKSTADPCRNDQQDKVGFEDPTRFCLLRITELPYIALKERSQFLPFGLSEGQSICQGHLSLI